MNALTASLDHLLWVVILALIGALALVWLFFRAVIGLVRLAELQEDHKE